MLVVVLSDSETLLPPGHGSLNEEAGIGGPTRQSRHDCKLDDVLLIVRPLPNLLGG